jgi:hypothetical protein
MTPAAAANEYAQNLGPDYCLEAELADFEAEQEEVDEAERQRRNVAYGEWLGMY